MAPDDIIRRPGFGLATPRNRAVAPALGVSPLGYDTSLADRWITPHRRDETTGET